MPKLPILKARDLMKVAKKTGFIYETTQGSHFIFRRPADGKLLSIPSHKGKDLGRGITKSLIKIMDLSDKDFIKLL